MLNGVQYSSNSEPVFFLFTKVGKVSDGPNVDTLYTFFVENMSLIRLHNDITFCWKSLSECVLSFFLSFPRREEDKSMQSCVHCVTWVSDKGFLTFL